MPRVPELTGQDQGLAAQSDHRVCAHSAPRPQTLALQVRPWATRDSTVSLHHHLCDALLTASARALAGTSGLLEGHNFKGCVLHTLDRNRAPRGKVSETKASSTVSWYACVCGLRGALRVGYKCSNVLKSAQNKQNLFPEPLLVINVKMPQQSNRCVTHRTHGFGPLAGTIAGGCHPQVFALKNPWPKRKMD